MPKLYIIAGPNGAGKTTFAKEFLPFYAQCPHFINADLIAQGLSPFSPSTVSVKAGRLLLEQIYDFVSQKKDFAIESTLAGKTYVNLVERVKEKGYSVYIFFLWIPNVKLAKDRIKQRVQEGGHDVPSADVARRFQRSVVNFFQVYQLLSDSWILIDNSIEIPSAVAYQVNRKIIVLNHKLFKKIKG